MGFRAVTCAECGKNIQIPDDIDNPQCPYCNAPVESQLGRHGNGGPDVVNLLGLARTAAAAENLAEAQKYYTQVLEINPQISEAWIGKGKSAGWQSSLADIRVKEMVVAFKNAIATCPESEKAAIIEQCVEDINHLVVTFYGMAHKHMLEFVSVPGTWEKYLGQIVPLIETLEEISVWGSPNRTVLENIIHLCKDNVEGVAYKDKFDNNMPKVWHLSPEYEQVLREKISNTAKKIQTLDSTYTPPTVEVKKPDNCFIVTATMGDPSHPTVSLLREFRDQWLLQRDLGKSFVSWYYRHGPRMAATIKDKRLLRTASFIFIVMPSFFIAKYLLSKK